MKLFLSLLMGGLLLPLSGWAADGDACNIPTGTDAAVDFDNVSRGRMRSTFCVAVCDNDTGDVDCTPFDLMSAGGIPDVLAFELSEVDIDDSGGAGDCTAVTVTINTAFESGLSTASENAHDLGTTTAVAIGGVTRIVLDAKQAPPGRWIYATSSASACTDDGWDLLMIGYEETKVP